jgi:polysaccharide chain length determinant protein (PEP-CTERM system associated)
MATSLTFQDPSEILSALWKRKIWLLGSILLGVGLAATSLVFMTPLYYASSLVMVEPQKVPAAYVRTTVTSELKDRLRTLEEQIESRESMEKLIDEIGLYAEVRDEVPMEALVAQAREDLTVDVDRGRIVEIGFVGTDPEQVAETTNRVTEMFISENLRQRERQAENTTAFLDAELERTQVRLEEKESLVSEFRLQNEGNLPGQRESNLSAIGQLERRLDQNRVAIEDVEMRMLIVDRPGESGPSNIPIVVQTDGAPVGREARLEMLELELQELKSKFTDRHPDVVRLKVEIDNLRKEVAREAATEKAREAEQVLVSDLPVATSLEMSGLQRELTRLEQDRESAMREISRYQRRLEQTPRIEQELIKLTRDYNNLEVFYQSLLSKQIEARMAEELERSQQSEQFTILQMAQPPTAPFYPNTMIVLAMGVILGSGLGIGSILLVHGLDQTFSDEESLRSAFPEIPFVTAIPKIVPAEDLKSHQISQHDQRSA